MESRVMKTHVMKTHVMKSHVMKSCVGGSLPASIWKLYSAGVNETLGNRIRSWGPIWAAEVWARDTLRLRAQRLQWP